MVMQPNSLDQSRSINLDAGRFIISKRLNKSDRSDIYRLRASKGSGFNLQLHSAESPVKATIGFDRNRNGRLDRREAIAQTAADSIASLARSNLQSGTYWIQVSPAQRGSAKYRLTLTPDPAAAPLPAALSPNRFINQVLRLSNRFRQQNGLKPLQQNDRLAIAAQQHCQNMAAQDFFEHLGQDGSTPQSRGTAAGYVGGVGENIAAGYTTPKAVVQGWIQSPAHRANLLNPNYRDIGIGFYDYPSDSGTANYRFYWAQNFGVPMA